MRSSLCYNIKTTALYLKKVSLKNAYTYQQLHIYYCLPHHSHEKFGIPGNLVILIQKNGFILLVLLSVQIYT